MEVCDNSNFVVIDGGKVDNDGEHLKCFKMDFQQIDFLTLSDLVRGFDTIKAITFSYDVDFVEHILQLGDFKYGEIVFGADFLVQKDKKLNNLLSEVFTNAYEATNVLRSHDKLCEMLKNGDIEFRTPTCVLDHRKFYLLKSDDGRTRVIETSANMTHSAWNGNHMEDYYYCDSEYFYDCREEDFETVWLNSCEIPYNMMFVDKDNLVESNPIIKKVKEVDTAIVLQQATEPIVLENIKFMISHDNIKDKYDEIFSDVKIPSSNGFIKCVPKTIKQVECNFKRMMQRYKVVDIVENYPSIVVNYDDNSVLLNDVAMNLSPSKDEVREDIENIISVFENFNEFTGNVERMKETHFKLWNIIFCSVFFAKLRCVAHFKGVDTDTLPLCVLVSSPKANSGKTFMIRMALKMMTGKDVKIYSMSDLHENGKKQSASDWIIRTQLACKGVPLFVDEVNNRFIGNIQEKILKGSGKRCEDKDVETMPMFIFAGNKLEQENTLRKRCVCFSFDNGLPSSVNKAARRARGNALIKKAGTAFYREYLHRMVKLVDDEMLYVLEGASVPEDYYIDIVKMSSSVILDIFGDYGYSVPSYMRVLTWADDYSEEAKYISESAVSDIKELYESCKGAFIIKDDKVIIEMKYDYDVRRQFESYEKVLPPEMGVKIVPQNDKIRLIMDRECLEERLGYRFSRGKLFDLFRRG